MSSLHDVDFYKDTAGQIIHAHHPDDVVTFELIVRTPDIRMADVIPEADLRAAMDAARALEADAEVLAYMRNFTIAGQRIFTAPYLAFLESLRLPPYDLTLHDGSYSLRFTGPWPCVTRWETIALAVLSELYNRAVMRMIPNDEHEAVYQRAMDLLERKLDTLAERPGIVFSDFGHRRRHSLLWQKWAVARAAERLGPRFTGTSDVLLAFELGLPPVGTSPHEWPMVLTALQDTDTDVRHAQYLALELWQQMYGDALQVFLPDTYGSAQFFANAPSWLVRWKGQRQDSGEPIDEGERYIVWLESHGEDPAAHLTVFSDGLDVDAMIAIDRHFGTRQPHPFGWGTLLVNDFRGCHPQPLLRPISMVCKVTAVNGRPVVKVPNDLSKATGDANEVQRYLRIFGAGDRSRRHVTV